jgi:hypothetical protein
MVELKQLKKLTNMLDLLEIIKIGGYPIAIAAFFYIWFVARPMWKRQGAKELLEEMRKNDKKIVKKNNYSKWTDEQIDNYINDITNNAQ